MGLLDQRLEDRVVELLPPLEGIGRVALDPIVFGAEPLLGDVCFGGLEVGADADAAR